VIVEGCGAALFRQRRDLFPAGEVLTFAAFDFSKHH
jgi:hypothetical protein